MNAPAIQTFRVLFVLAALTGFLPSFSQSPATPVYPVLRNKWQQEGDNSIFYDASGSAPVDDHIEMSGTRASMWVRYSLDTGKRMSLDLTAVYPSFRLKPNDTHASLMYMFRPSDLPRFFIGDKPLQPAVINGNFYPAMDERVTGVRQDGIMQVYSHITGEGASVGLKRELFPSTDKPAVFQYFSFTNKGKTPVAVTMEYFSKTLRTDPAQSQPAPHSLTVKTVNPGAKTLAPGDTVLFGVVYYASNDDAVKTFDLLLERNARQTKLGDFAGRLQLETPDTILNAAFAFAKRRISESIFDTKTGPMMCPGGLKYYAAIWANDEAEYANPFYAFTGDSTGIRAAVNTYGMFSKYMNDGYHPLPSSIIAEGDSIWAGAGDRGDAAMIASGAARFALVNGNIDTARKLWPLISWCLEYCRRKLNDDGVLNSESDELEGRFPSGSANLEANSLYYDALVSGAALSRALGGPAAESRGYEKQSAALAKAIERYFGAEMKGFHTYRYYKENTKLRSWICMPLAVGLTARKKGTIDALFSPALFSPDGILTEEGSATFWDRSTLYSLRGIFAAGETGRGISFLHYYSQRRLLGDHVPYPVEAWPEGNQRHLAGESALYCRIFTEGLFGIRPAGFRSFDCTPQLPAGWQHMALKQLDAFGNRFDLLVDRGAATGNKLDVTIVRAGVPVLHYPVENGKTVRVTLN